LQVASVASRAATKLGRNVLAIAQYIFYNILA